MTYHDTGIEKPRRRSSRWIRLVMLLLVVLAVAAGVMYRDSLTSRLTSVLAATNEDPIPVQELRREPFQLEVPAFGEIIGLETVPVSTPTTRAGGLKIASLILEGSFVNEGDIVVRYDSTDATLNLERQQNTLDANQERIKITSGNQSTTEKTLAIDKKDAEEDYEYAMTVLPQDETIFSKWDIIEAKINAGFAKEKIGVLTNRGKVQKRIARSDQQILAIEKNKAQAEISISQQTLNSLELKAPKGGLVVYRKTPMLKDPQVGDESWPGQVVMELVDLSALQARIYVLERDAANLVRDREVVIRLDSIPDREFHGKIRMVPALAQPLERNSPLKYFTCDVSVHDAGEDLRRIRPGMALKARVVLEKYNSCFVVPSSAISMKGSDPTVYVRQGDKFVARVVKIGANNHGQATILDGVQEHDMMAMRNPFETRKLQLPDFSKGSTGQRGPGGGPGGGRGMMIRIDH